MAIVNAAKKFFASRKPRPDEVLLTIEVSDSSLSTDRGRKLRIYAAAGLSPYWIVNIRDGTVEVRTDPHTPAGGPAGYRTLNTYEPGDTLTFSLAGRDFTLPVAELLPEPAAAGG